MKLYITYNLLKKENRNKFKIDNMECFINAGEDKLFLKTNVSIEQKVCLQLLWFVAVSIWIIL